MQSLHFLTINRHNAGQKRKDGTSYIFHPMHVAEMVKDAEYDERYQTVAVLHDTLEDTDAAEDDILVFGEDILHSVKLLTRPDGMDEAVYVANILTDHMASVVKTADKIHNLQDIVVLGGVGSSRTKENRDKADRYIQKAEKYYMGKFGSVLDDVIRQTRQCLDNDIIRYPERVHLF